MANTLTVRDLRTYYKTRLNEKVFAVDGIDLDLAEGKVLGIAGESGCGKSTLALSLMGYYFPPLHFDRGSIVIDGQNIMDLTYEELRVRFLGKKIAYIPQAAMNALNPTRRVIRFIEDILAEYRPELDKSAVEKLATEKFEHLNLPLRVLNAYPNELSGGMKQRTVIAISTLLNPDILIADEPTSALDVSSQKIVVAMLRRMLDEGDVKSMIFITHELPLLRHVADDIVVMYAGEFVEKGTAEQVIFHSVHPYSHALMGSIIVPEEGMKSKKLNAIPGAPPNLKKVPDGCRFHERCRYCVEMCKSGGEASKDGKKIGIRSLPDGRYYRCIFSEAELTQKYSREAK